MSLASAISHNMDSVMECRPTVINGRMNEESQPAQGTLCSLMALKFLRFQKGKTQRTVWVFANDAPTHTHTVMHTDTQIFALRGVLESSLLKKVWVQLVWSETASSSAAPTVLMLLVGSADCTRHTHMQGGSKKTLGVLLTFY